MLVRNKRVYNDGRLPISRGIVYNCTYIVITSRYIYMNNARLQIRIDKKLKAKLRKLAKRKHITMSALIRMGLVTMLAQESGKSSS